MVNGEWLMVNLYGARQTYFLTIIHFLNY